MKFEEIMQVIKELSNSQGFYGRLYNGIMTLDDEDLETTKQELERQNFKDVIDIILYFES